MRQTGINYFKKYNTADITILSDYGIDTSEQEQIQKAENNTKTLKKHEFKIVGFVKSSEILSSLNLGQTTCRNR